MSVLREEYEESQHPRGEHGRLTAKGGLGTQEHLLLHDARAMRNDRIITTSVSPVPNAIQDQRSRAQASIRSIGAPLSVKAKSFRALDR